MTSQQQSLKKEADVVFQQHNFKKATELYTNAIDVDPSSELAGTLFSNRSLCHHKLGNFQEALKDGISATTLKPNWARGYLRVASAYESLGKEDEAIDAYQKSLDLEENEETRRIYIALFRKNVDDMKKSQEELKVIGNGYVQKNKYDEAVIIYNACIDLDPSIESAAPIYSNRSLAFFNLGRFQEAEDDACMAIFLRPEFARGYLRRGNAAMKLEKWKESSEAFEKYFELDPENAKSDPDAVKNKNSAKKSFVHEENEKRNHNKMIERKRAEIMAIKNEAERMQKMMLCMCQQLAVPSAFDVDLVRMLVECGAELVPTQLDAPRLVLLRKLDPRGGGDGSFSFLISLLSTRIKVPLKVLPQLDELIFFVIDKMLREGISFVGWELSVSCDRRTVGPVNPKILRVLLETNKFDVNQNYGEGRPAPLVALLMGMIESLEVPPEAPDCLHLLLNWKGIDVNAVSAVGVQELTALGFVRHPEVAKILIRYGANVNAVTSYNGEPANILDHIFCEHYNSDREELVRLLIQSGARLLPNGRDKKSSLIMVRIVAGVVNPETQKHSFVSEEVLQMMFQLNRHQGLLFTYQNPTSSAEMPFLLNAIREGAPLRFVELLCAMNPAPMKETGIDFDGEVITVGAAVAKRIGKQKSSLEESMQVFGLLLEHGLDLCEPICPGKQLITFAVLCNICCRHAQAWSLLQKTIVEKKGEGEFLQCAVMMNILAPY